MLIYKQRYKPRTTREFTKSDLTVYDSAGNTALNALTVYGKSEVVDGSIKSAGEGWATVDLGTLNWSYESEFSRFQAELPNFASIYVRSTPMICKTYLVIDDGRPISNVPDKSIYSGTVGSSNIYVVDTDYTDATDFKTAMSGVLLCYQLDDPTLGNCIAVKTDDGTGINGTMATFSTGTPLQGIPDTTVRDVMTWDGSAGTVTKKYGEVDLGTLTWNYDTTYQRFYTSSISTTIKTPANTGTIANIITPKYTSTSIDYLIYITPFVNNVIAVGGTGSISIRDTNYTDATAFKNSLIGVKLVYELATPTTEQLTTAENDSLAGLRTFEPQTHAQNNARTEMTVDYTIKVPTI